MSTETTPETLCTACYTTVNQDDAFCGNCSYPLKGTEMEQQTFLVYRQNAEVDLEDIKKKLRRATVSLYYLAGVCAFWALLTFFTSRNQEGMVAGVIVEIVLAAIYLVLGEYSKKKPLACLICGLALYVIIMVLNAIGDPKTLVSGIIFKIAIIGYLVYGIKATMEAEKLKKEYNLS